MEKKWLGQEVELISEHWTVKTGLGNICRHETPFFFRPLKHYLLCPKLLDKDVKRQVRLIAK